jgi:hypothetical protein
MILGKLSETSAIRGYELSGTVNCPRLGSMVNCLFDDRARPKARDVALVLIFAPDVSLVA